MFSVFTVDYGARIMMQMMYCLPGVADGGISTDENEAK